jgi:hypothetical protein
MSIYSLIASNISQQSPVIRKGDVRLYSSVAIYFMVGENPVIDPSKCALLRAGEAKDMRFPVKCSKLAIQAVHEAGFVTITEANGGASARCN